VQQPDEFLPGFSILTKLAMVALFEHLMMGIKVLLDVAIDDGMLELSMVLNI
jgi:hypothetical protein